LSKTTSVDDVTSLYPRQAKRHFLPQRWLQIAAAITITLIASFAISRFAFQPANPHYEEKMILNDGTIVWISEPADFGYYEKDGARFADFSGTALFEVAKNPNSPFTISCGNINVRVVGTSFILKAADGQIELGVLTGKVHVGSTKDIIGVDVNPHEKLVYSTKGIIEHTSIDQAELSVSSDNEEYNLKFQGTTMDKVIASISRKFDVSIIVKQEQLNKCHISADFTDHSLKDTLSILVDLLDVSYQIRGKQVELSGPGC
jgi:hypothetical protein